jgi:Na+/H+ antiporter NhaC
MEPAPGIPIRAYRAVVPLFVFISVTLFEILRTGLAELPEGVDVLSRTGFTDILAEADSIWALMIGSTCGFVLAALMSFQAGMRGDIPKAAWSTLRSMWIAIAILYLAWMLSAACDEIGTAEYLTVSLGDLQLPMLLPMILFGLAGAVAFATGSSWGTMGILLPLVVGLSYKLGSQIDIGPYADGDASGYFLMILSIGAVLEGSIFGDHCSPISDTTVLSSVASASDHIDHVRTQAPYALLCMLFALVVGYMPAAAFGLSSWISIPAGVFTLLLTMRLLGRGAEDPSEKYEQTFA